MFFLKQEKYLVVAGSFKGKGIARELLEYAHKRLSYCKFGNEKTSCKRCPIHCYKKDMKIKIKQVMRFSGCRLIIYRPYEFIRHIFK